MFCGVCFCFVSGQVFGIVGSLQVHCSTHSPTHLHIIWVPAHPLTHSTHAPRPCSLGARLEAAVAAGDGLACHNLTMVAAHLFLSGVLRPDVVHSMLDTWRER